MSDRVWPDGSRRHAKALEEATHLEGFRLQHEDHRVVIERPDRREPNRLTVPGELVVEHHRVAHQGLELGDRMVIADDVVVAIDGIARRIAGELMDERGGVRERVLHAGQERAPAVLARLAIAEDVEEQAEDRALGTLVPAR